MLYNNIGDNMKIKQIKKQGTKYKIILENNEIITTYDEIILANNILYKKEIDETLIQKITNENENVEAYNKIIKFIKTKLRSRKEIEEYMNKQNIEKQEQQKILKKLEEQKLINDKLYVQAFIHDKISFSNEGPNKIRKELIKNQIDENDIEEELKKIDNEQIKEKLTKLIIKKISTNKKYSNNIIKQKILNHFINLGYEKNDILYILETNTQKDNEILKKEYIKLLNKLKNKYKDDELKFKIKQKLYQKGFEIDEINNLLN